jgi:hypothetical protein
VNESQWSIGKVTNDEETYSGGLNDLILSRGDLLKMISASAASAALRVPDLNGDPRHNSIF